jgi:mono/diheme cytochrome c family protein
VVHDGGREGLRRPPAARLAIAALLVLASGCAAGAPRQGLATSAVADGAGRAIRDGVYTEEQGRRGEAFFLATCASCHKPELTGSQIVPALVGDAFLERWSRKTAGDLFEKVRSMPPVPIPVRPTAREYADIVAFILSRNSIPAGQQELAADFEALATIRMGE